MTEHHEVVIVGAGISGVCAAIKLREAGIDDVVVLEKAETYGGTWRANTYPGLACDVPSGLYSYSFAPNSEWSRLFSEQPEILAYVEGVARDAGLDDVTRFGEEVLDARWDAAQAIWNVTTTSGTLTVTHVVAAAGPWNEPNIPDIPGLSDFDGEVFHSARWNHDYDLTGKQIAVIGTGASAVQFVPRIREQAAEVHLFQRTAHWVLPKPDHPVPGFEKWAMRRLPGAQAGLRGAEYGMLEAVGAAYHRPRPYMYALQAVGKAYLRATVRDKELRRTLTPNYLLGCKRILFSNNYYQSLTKPNVSVHGTAVDAVKGSTIVGADGTTAEVDAIILGTGFQILDMPVAERVRGTDGRTLAEHWGGSPEAYLGTMVAGFPNAFIVLGPSLGTGHSSAFTIVESQVSLIVQAIGVARAKRASIEVPKEVQDAYIAEVQAALPGTAYNLTSCHSYYIDSNGRNSFSWPWSTAELVRRVSRFDPSVYTFTAREREEVSA
jgi:cation diffusion facilitator CzcD-associated flavoprotein CzcO